LVEICDFGGGGQLGLERRGKGFVGARDVALKRVRKALDER
jgi:hypothetical protein